MFKIPRFKIYGENDRAIQEKLSLTDFMSFRQKNTCPLAPMFQGRRWQV